MFRYEKESGCRSHFQCRSYVCKLTVDVSGMSSGCDMLSVWGLVGCLGCDFAPEKLFSCNYFIMKTVMMNTYFFLLEDNSLKQPFLLH